MSANFLGNSVISFDFPDSNADRTRSYNVQKTGHIDRLFAPSIKSNIQIFIGKYPRDIFNSWTWVLWKKFNEIEMLLSNNHFDMYLTEY